MLVLHVGCASTARAELLLGKTVEVRNQFHGAPAIGPNSVQVTHEIEFPNWGGQGYNSLDELDDGFIYTSLGSAQRDVSPNLIQISDILDVVPDFTGIQIVDASVALNDASRLFVDRNTFWYDVGGLFTNVGDFVHVRVTAVPEPSTFVLLFLGVCWIGYYRRRPVMPAKT